MKITANIAANLTSWMEATPSLDTLKKVSARSGVGFGTVQRAKNGDGNPTITNLVDIARAFGHPVESLLAVPDSAATRLKAAEPETAYNSDAAQILEYFADLAEDDAEIFKQELKLAAMKARRKKQEKSDRQPAGAGDPLSESKRTA